MGDYRRPLIPRPMTNPCLYCTKGCTSKEEYKCEMFRIMFIIEWEHTVAFLREQFGRRKEE